MCVGGKELVYHSKESYYSVSLQGHSIYQIKHNLNTWKFFFKAHTGKTTKVKLIIIEESSLVIYNDTAHQLS